MTSTISQIKDIIITDILSFSVLKAPRKAVSYLRNKLYLSANAYGERN